MAQQLDLLIGSTHFMSLFIDVPYKSSSKRKILVAVNECSSKGTFELTRARDIEIFYEIVLLKIQGHGKAVRFVGSSRYRGIESFGM